MIDKTLAQLALSTTLMLFPIASQASEFRVYQGSVYACATKGNWRIYATFDDAAARRLPIASLAKGECMNVYDKTNIYSGTNGYEGSALIPLTFRGGPMPVIGGVSGKRVSGAVCRDFFKGSTVRLD